MRGHSTRSYRTLTRVCVAEHFYALAEFAIQRPSVTTQIPSETDSLFYASFDAPSLKFLCSHDVLLNLTFNKGHIVLESSRSTQRYIGRRATHRSTEGFPTDISSSSRQA